LVEAIEGMSAEACRQGCARLMEHVCDAPETQTAQEQARVIR
jgi:hypothetical protein